ncbi:hypothetical protein ARMGADRAFT_1064560 [Armillaria gallica]|uniref:Uncharacterized protein n=1 Tax=Armillaria gallica TaxID=47427 RepID=A0A2H3D9R5_ARMGA|nr:hypothetical protein ARMGADRAFT_1064560 [Armillaria gallica]
MLSGLKPYHLKPYTSRSVVHWAVLYSSLMLTTLLWCTILIIYRILIVGRAAGRTHVYQRLIEMLVESASLYSVVIVVLLVLQVLNDGAGKQSRLQFWSGALQQGMRVQMTPGVKVPQCHRFDSEVIQVRRMTAKWALDLNGTHLRTQGRTWKKAWKAVHRINTRGYLADLATYTILDFFAHTIQYREIHV